MAIVETELAEGVLSLTLNDPDRRNPLSAEMLTGLRREIERASSDRTVRAIRISGTGSAFCAGGDLVDMDTVRPAEMARLMAGSQALVQDLTQMPLPVVMSVNGVAAGAGFALAMAGDIVLAADDAIFLPAFARIGAVPDLGLAQTLQRSIGLHQTLRILLLGEKLPATKALELGLLAEVVASDHLATRSFEVARQLAAGPTIALGLSKQLIRTAALGATAPFLDAEANAQGLAFSTADFTEGLAALLERRAPKFTGR